jgi:D-serine deaminase-like pyridoxal phosphate-dependent protein
MKDATKLETPAVTILLDVMEDNLRRIQAEVSRHGIAFRPHIKTHKIPALGKLQMQAGAVGITCQKIGEVEVFADAKVADDVLLTFNILGEAKTDRLMAQMKRLKRLAVVLDNEPVAKGLSEAALRHGTEVRFLVECDTGMGRNGVQTPQQALDLARAALRLPRMHFEGLLTFPLRPAGASLANPKLSAPGSAAFFREALRLFKDAGIPVPVVSGGGTPAIFALQDYPMLTEHRAGTYLYNDVMTVASGTATWDNCAMRVRATVVSRPTPDRAVFDCGTKVLTSDQYTVTGYGHVLEYPEAVIPHLSEEHGVIDLGACKRKPEIGEVIHVVPNHCCVVSNMVDEVYGVRNGKLETTWKVAARGSVK